MRREGEERSRRVDVDKRERGERRKSEE